MPAPRSLADDLRSRDDATLAELLAGRPDLAAPVPGDTASLAARASTRVSAQRAVDRLSTPQLQVLEALVALSGSTADPVALPALVRACSAPRARVLPHVRHLHTLALAWGPDAALRPVRAAADVLGPTPAGLGATLREAHGTRSPARIRDLVEDLGLAGTGDPVGDLDAVAALLADPARLAELLADAPPASRELLDRLTWGPPTGAVPGADRAIRTAEAGSPLEWLLARGLLAAAGPGHVVLPREVAVALRGGAVLARLDDEPPALARTRHSPHVDGAAAGQAAEAVRLVEALLTAWSAAPPPVLRAGGLGVRELKRLGDRLEVDADQAAFWAELARAAGLVADDGEADAAWAPTPASDDWLDLPVPQRWAELAGAWLRTSRVPGLVGEKDARGSARTALSDDLDRTAAAPVRRMVLEALASLDPGEATSETALLDRVRWQAPRRVGALAPRLVAWTLREGAWLGALGLGAVAEHGRALLDQPPADVAEVLRRLLPEPVEQVLLQADLTAIAPGPLVHPVAAELALAADVDSRGGATVYRFTPSSVRRVMDLGRSADDVLAFLRGASATPVPQALEVLVRDVARRHGRLRVGTASSYLRSDDEAALAEVLAARAAAPLRLRRLAPTVAAAQADPATVLDVLRSMGMAPAVEGDDGDVVVRSPTARRTPPRQVPRPVTGEPPTPSAETVTAVVAGLRSGDSEAVRRAQAEADGTGEPPQLTATDPASALAALRDAAAQGRAVWVGMSDAAGRLTVRQYSPVAVDGGLVTALDATSGQVRTMSVHRISGVAPA
ncbi:Helicase conserved C-terminal domain-containing protein [Quadrisphaera granulorum]|uniref:XPB/Ssl2-like helicase family protein n=1 Tax=Quadrisphaera granulorum TaxID=317664 RepID=A0A316ACS7_9ACTN|nr:helicase-associated domain-containing protein [Quadrisphaera granulorum]PWJ55209.1 XPB/Ssl2-like helicase family protein [Quadrisphaera granulorum]SZE95718.1 Helicase conserved C-terminal domain-containing protein [Quadrisphaera granulorum]